MSINELKHLLDLVKRFEAEHVQRGPIQNMSLPHTTEMFKNQLTWELERLGKSNTPANEDTITT